MDNKTNTAFEEFKTFCDDIRKMTGWNKKTLAKKLGISPNYYSRLYHKKAKAMSEPVLANARKIAQELGVGNVSASSPDKVLVQENLPKDAWVTREEFTKLQAQIDSQGTENRKLLKEVAVLEKDLERAKSDSEKKYTNSGQTLPLPSKKKSTDFQVILPDKRQAK